MTQQAAGATSAKMTSEQFYEHLRGTITSSQKLKNLAGLWEVLQEQRDRHATNYTISLIARLTGARGGLKESSIRNEAGADYRTLIGLFADEQGRKPEKNMRMTSWQEELLASISDVASRARVGVILSENRKLKTELDLIKNAIQREYIVPEDRPARPKSASSSLSIEVAHEGGNPEVVQASILPPASSLLSQERKAVEQFISEENLGSHAWSITPAGGLKSGTGEIIARPGFIPALKKLLFSA